MLICSKKLGVWITLAFYLALPCVDYPSWQLAAYRGYPSKHAGCPDTLDRARTKGVHVLHATS